MGANVRLTLGHVWDAVQCEVALEKFFWGKVQRFGLKRSAQVLIRQLAVNLGPGHNVPGRCDTDQSGFLKLVDAHVSGVLAYEMPPIDLWVDNSTQVRQGMYGCFKS